MRVTLFIVLILAFLFPENLLSQANWNNSSFVHQGGKYILDGNNDTIRLNGVNLGGWLMWEGWIWGGGFIQEKSIYNDIESIIGTTEADAFRDSVYENYITEEDIAAISAQCHNVVRIPFNHFILEDDFNPYVYKQSGWDRLDSVLSWCENHNVYAILDLHSAPGGQSNLFTSDPDLFINLWNGSINQQRTYRLWKAIALRYKDRGIIAGYDLLNEPDVNNDSTLLYVYQNIRDSIRSVDTNHMLFIEGNNYAEDFSMFTSPLDNNMAYEFHFYTWFISSGKADSLAKFTTLADTSNIPVWCGEWGEENYTALSENKALFDDPANSISGSAIWTWKKVIKPSAQPYYVGVDTTSDWNKSVNWIGMNWNPQPSYSEMTNGINEFINNLSLANANFNTALNDIVYNCLNAGLDQNSMEDGFLIYPNPATEILYLNTTSNIKILDLSGKELMVLNMTNKIDISELEAGTYILIRDDGKYQKFIKQ
ncbi:MAG: cellulase family glycosylhydrolase [Crocinitomicaceae bacterium]|nr:cellulase family glycosylhydrolase [Crocinitomicaceae bacterium]